MWCAMWALTPSSCPSPPLKLFVDILFVGFSDQLANKLAAVFAAATFNEQRKEMEMEAVRDRRYRSRYKHQKHITPIQ